MTKLSIQVHCGKICEQSVLTAEHEAIRLAQAEARMKKWAISVPRLMPSSLPLRRSIQYGCGNIYAAKNVTLKPNSRTAVFISYWGIVNNADLPKDVPNMPTGAL